MDNTRFPWLEEEEIKMIEDLTESVPERDRMKAQQEVYESIIKVKEKQENRKEKSRIRDENKDSEFVTIQDRTSNFCDFVKETLSLDDDVSDEEVLDGFSEDFPELQMDLANYINDWDETIFSLLEDEEWVSQAPVDPVDDLWIQIDEGEIL